jgi:predicted aspartyl protease
MPVSINFRDTIPFSKRLSGHLIIPVKINNVNRELIFDTGASKCVLPENSIRKSGKRQIIRDTHGKLTFKKLGLIDNL